MYSINERLSLRHPPEGPFEAHIRPFGEWAFEQGYSKQRVQRRVHLAAGFSQWLKRKGVRVREVSGKHSGQYLQHRAHGRRIFPGDKPSMKQFLEFLRCRGIVAAEKTNVVSITPVHQCVQEFKAYLQDNAR